MADTGHPTFGRQVETPFYITGRELDQILQAQVRGALLEHKLAGRSVAVWRNGQVISVAAGDIEL
jgi:hypothetical protein